MGLGFLPRPYHKITIQEIGNITPYRNQVPYQLERNPSNSPRKQ